MASPTAIAAAKKELAEATLAMNVPSCTQGPAQGLPAVVCNPALAAKTEQAGKKLAALMGGGGHMKMILLTVAVAAGIGGFLWWKKKKS